LFQSADIRIDVDHPFHRGSLYTQQSRGCGQPGEFMAMPANFLVDWNATVETWRSPAKMFVHEWAKLRYGVFDEFGFAGTYICPQMYIHTYVCMYMYFLFERTYLYVITRNGSVAES
jgi:hypothetical protein